MPQFQATKELCVDRYDHGREVHRQRTYAHGECNSPVDKGSSRCWDSNHVIRSRPYEILHHFSIAGPRQSDRADNVARVAAHKDDPSRLHGDICAGADGNSDVRRGKRRCIVHTVADHCHFLAAGLKALDCRCLVAGSTCAATSSIPSCFATESATVCESPVIIATRTPRSCNAFTATRDSGRISSSTASAPITPPSRRT